MQVLSSYKQAIRIKQEFFYAHHQIAMFVITGFHAFFDDDDLLEGIHRMFKGFRFLFILFLIGDRVCRLDIVFFAA